MSHASGKMSSYVQPCLLVWAHWTPVCTLGPTGCVSIAQAANYQVFASRCRPDIAWLSICLFPPSCSFHSLFVDGTCSLDGCPVRAAIQIPIVH